jgi:serine/threonine-protein kinase
VVKIVLDLLAGLQGAHSVSDDYGQPLQLVHCDVSPHNLLIGLDGNCRLTDFGVARSRERANRAQQTHGKPNYLAPEQITGGEVDGRADVFAAGIVLYNALTGTTLFQAGSIEDTLRNVLHQKILPPSQLALVPAPEFDAVCMQALERDPSNRFQTAEEMMMELRKVAIQNDALATSREVGAWVQHLFGQELQLRRLASLDSFLGSGVAFDAPEADERPTPSPSGEASQAQQDAASAAAAAATASERIAYPILIAIILAAALLLAWVL